MENLINSTSLQSNEINIPNSYIINITDIPHNDNNSNTNNKTSIITFINESLLENNKTNNILSSELIISKTNLDDINDTNYSSINPILDSSIYNINDTIESIESSIPSYIYQSTYINNTINNNLLNGSNIKSNDSYDILFDKFNNSTNITNIANITKQIIDNITDNSLHKLNNTNNSISINNKTKSFLPNNVTIPIINKTYDTNYALGFGIAIPIILILLIVLICHCIKKKIKAKITSVPDYDLNRINFKNKGAKSYNKLQNTSNLNPGMNANNISMSEIKVQNLKDEIHNIISNSSGGSNSSGKRKREKRKGNNTNSNALNNLGSKEKQNEIKDQIKQYVIDENK